VKPIRSPRCYHRGVAAAAIQDLPPPQVLRSSLPCFIFPFFVFLKPIRFPFFLRRPQQALERGTETMRNAKNRFVASWFFGSWGTIAVDDGGSQQGLCFSLAEASAKVHLLLYSAPSTRRNSSGTSSLWRARGAGKREKPRLRKPRRHDHAASCIRSVQYLKSFIVNRRRDTRKADNRRRRALRDRAMGDATRGDSR
jgi:hypothetical protein